MDSRVENYDVIVIGAGHNGLAAAVRLARRGRRVLVVEAKSEPGGAIKTRELTLPGFRHDVCATNLALFAGSSFFHAHKDELLAHGLAFARAEDSYATVFRDGTFVGVSRALEKTLASISKFSPADARAWQELLAQFGDDVRYLGALLASPMPSWDTFKIIVKAWRENGAAWVLDALKLLVATPRDFLEARFEHPKIKALLAMWGLHLDFAPDVAGGALFVYFQGMAGQKFGITFGQGGAETMVKAMVGVLKQEHGDLILGDAVVRVNVSNGVATGVTLQSGRQLQAKTVIANLHPKIVFGKLVARDTDRMKFERAIEKYRPAPSSMMVHLAMEDLPDWQAGKSLRSFAYVHVAPDLEMMSRAYAEASAGLLPAEPVVVVGQPTAIDPSRAPHGKHILWLNVRLMPTEIRGDAAGLISATTWDDAKEAYADRVLDIVENYAPGLKSRILARSIVSPLDLERENPNLLGGDNLSGSHHLDQNFFFRPVAGWSRYRTPVRNLYLCGASTWPGAGTGAGSGFILAKMLAR
jgi:phytoene dehydrogenase-like protein